MNIEEAKNELNIIIETVRDIFKIDKKEEKEDIYNLDNIQVIAIETVLNELNKKDKIIDMMASKILLTRGVTEFRDIPASANDIKEYFYKKAEESKDEY